MWASDIEAIRAAASSMAKWDPIEPPAQRRHERSRRTFQDKCGSIQPGAMDKQFYGVGALKGLRVSWHPLRAG